MERFFDHWQYIKEEIEGGEILLFLDYDGTLTSIVDHPDQAVMTEETRELLQELRSLKNITIAIISGRGLDDVICRIGIDGIIYVGNHGLEVRGAGIEFEDPLAPEQKEIMKEIYKTLKDNYRAHKLVYIEDKGSTLSVHYRRVSQGMMDDVGRIFHTIIDPYVSEGSIEITEGKKVWEIRPIFMGSEGPINKGAATFKLIKHLLKKEKKAAVFYFGDDTTDEDAFKALKMYKNSLNIKAYSVKVGLVNNSKSDADYYVRDVRSVKRFLKEFKEFSSKNRI